MLLLWLYVTLVSQEFESYHFVKFNRPPKIIKKKVTSGKLIATILN